MKLGVGLGIGALATILLTGVGVGCGSDGGGAGGPATVNNSGGTTASGGAASGGSAGTFAGSGNQGGSIAIDGGGGSAGTVGDGGGCSSVAETADASFLPVDILVVVDNSGSMTTEVGFVQNAMNTFSNGIATAGIDVHVVMISSPPGIPFVDPNGICVPAPLGSGQCPNDTNLPGFVHILEEIGSSNSLSKILQFIGQVTPHFRADSTKHVIVVTDDNSSLDAASFDSQFRAALTAAGQNDMYTFHAIYGFEESEFGSPCLGQTEEIGTVYRQLAQMTGGQEGNLCLQAPAFTDTFNAVSMQVVSGKTLACEWVIPPPPAGMNLDPNLVNVEFTPVGGAPEAIGRVDDASQCGGVVDGWYYDNPAAPTKILVCPDTCTRLQNAGANSIMDIQFGCESFIAPPR